MYVLFDLVYKCFSLAIMTNFLEILSPSNLLTLLAFIRVDVGFSYFFFSHFLWVLSVHVGCDILWNLFWELSILRDCFCGNVFRIFSFSNKIFHFFSRWYFIVPLFLGNGKKRRFSLEFSILFNFPRCVLF